MRIIAGTLSGRTFASPPGNRTHPMSEKARGGLFNALGDISDLQVLDAFSGSGALGLEAVSRGARPIMAIEKDRAAQRTIAENITALRVTARVRLIRAGAGAWLNTSDEVFDIVLLDPPYNDLQPSLLIRLAERVVPGGLVVASLPPTAELALPPTYELLSRKSYGDATLVFYRRIS